MKIEKLYTLSQFVDLMCQYVDNGKINIFNAFDAIDTYNDFLKQPIKKEMFVNDVEKPTDMYDTEQYFGSKMDEWQEAEKKVIFEHDYEIRLHNDHVHVGVLRAIYFDDNNPCTLGELAYRYNGELKLKNVEL